MDRLKTEDWALLQAKKKKKKKKRKEKNEKKKRIESNQSRSDRSGAKGRMNMDEFGGYDGGAHDEVDQTEDDRSSRDKLINNQA